MGSKIFVNLPVRDLARSKEFFSRLGYSFNQQFTDDNAACLVITEDIYAMLLVEKFFQTFTRKAVVDATQGTEAILALSVDRRDQVDELVDAALAAGGKPANEPMDQPPMYSRSFADPDGHQWEILWMDPAALAG
jgi:predicted lactoylglutathione lyase